MSVLDDIKALKNITDNNKDNELNIYIRRAETLIRNYLNIDDTVNISEAYPDAVICYLMEQLGRKGNEGMRQFVQGSRSGTLDNGGLSDDIKSLLPLPSANLLG